MNKDLDKELLGRIHAEKKRQSIDDADYRKLLHEHFRVESSKDLTTTDKLHFIEILKNYVYTARFELALKVSAAQKRHIAYLRNCLRWTNKQVDKYIEKHFGIDHASWMSSQDARGAITGMKKILEQSRIKK